MDNKILVGLSDYEKNQLKEIGGILGSKNMSETIRKFIKLFNNKNIKDTAILVLDKKNIDLCKEGKLEINSSNGQTGVVQKIVVNIESDDGEVICSWGQIFSKTNAEAKNE